MARLTYLDASVLIAAARGTEPLFHVRRAEVTLYERVLAGARQPGDLEAVVRTARVEAAAHGLGALDALQIAAAAAVGAEELVTGETRDKPIFRTRLVTIRSIR